MPLSAGARLGPYEIPAPLGAGGMGEVYRARDTDLNRDVALKVLPDVVAADPDRLARFEREAQALAALNHPHIAQIYGIERRGGTRALVMELVEGEATRGYDMVPNGHGFIVHIRRKQREEVVTAIENAHAWRVHPKAPGDAN